MDETQRIVNAVNNLKATDWRKVISDEIMKEINILEEKILNDFSCNHNKNLYTQNDIERIQLKCFKNFLFKPEEILRKYDVSVDNLEDVLFKEIENKG